MKEDKVFLDTNILVYAYDVSSGSKNDIARNIVAAAIKSGASILMTEDSNNGQIIEGVMVKNHFVA